MTRTPQPSSSSQIARWSPIRTIAPLRSDYRLGHDVRGGAAAVVEVLDPRRVARNLAAVRRVADDVGIDDAGAKRRDPDPLRRELRVERLAQPDNRELRGRVGDELGARDEASERRRVDDV